MTIFGDMHALPSPDLLNAILGALKPYAAHEDVRGMVRAAVAEERRVASNWFNYITAIGHIGKDDAAIDEIINAAAIPPFFANQDRMAMLRIYYDIAQTIYNARFNNHRDRKVLFPLFSGQLYLGLYLPQLIAVYIDMDLIACTAPGLYTLPIRMSQYNSNPSSWSSYGNYQLDEFPGHLFTASNYRYGIDVRSTNSRPEDLPIGSYINFAASDGVARWVSQTDFSPSGIRMTYRVPTGDVVETIVVNYDGTVTLDDGATDASFEIIDGIMHMTCSAPKREARLFRIANREATEIPQ